jgi:hypothetical protein
VPFQVLDVSNSLNTLPFIDKTPLQDIRWGLTGMGIEFSPPAFLFLAACTSSFVGECPVAFFCTNNVPCASHSYANTTAPTKSVYGMVVKNMS